VPTTLAAKGPLPPVTPELLRALPKTDLHCHLDGSLRLATILDLADRQKIRLPGDTPEGVAKALHMGEQCASLEDYLVAFDVTLAVLQTEEALHRAAYELATDCAAENVRYLEVRYSPVLHTRNGLKPTAIVDAVLEGLRQAKRETRIESSVIICGIRHIDPRTSSTRGPRCGSPSSPSRTRTAASSATTSPAPRRATRRRTTTTRSSSSSTTT
jgi:adenosine deaminase